MGFPSIGYFAVVEGEFTNVKMDKLVSKLVLRIQFRLSYSPWSNGISERNHTTTDTRIKKILEDK